MIKVEIVYDEGTATATDENENQIFYIRAGREYLKPSIAYFNGVSYSKTDFRWKRDKRGAVSQEFYDWLKAFDKAVYNKHHNVEDESVMYSNLITHLRNIVANDLVDSDAQAIEVLNETITKLRLIK